MINAGTVGAYLELDISQFRNSLMTAGQLLEQFRTEKERTFNDSGIAAALLLGALSAPLIAAGRAATDFAGVFGRAMGNVRKNADVTGSVIGGIGASFQSVSDSASELTDSIKSALGKLPDNAAKCIQASCLGMKNELNAAQPALSAAAKKDGNSIVTGFDSVLGTSGGLYAVGNKAVVNLSRGIDSKKPTAVAAMNGIMRGMLTAAGNVKFTGIGSSVVGGIAKGLNAGKSGLLATAASIASGIAKKIKAVLKISSPSKVTQEIGLFTARGLELGIRQGERDLYEAGSKAAANLVKGITDNTPNSDRATDVFSGTVNHAGTVTIGPLLSNRMPSVRMQYAGLTAGGEPSTVHPQVPVTRPPHLSDGLCDTASFVSSDIADLLSGISSHGSVFSNAGSAGCGDRLDRLLDAVEKLADSQTMMEIDGRSFGRMVREYV